MKVYILPSEMPMVDQIKWKKLAGVSSLAVGSIIFQSHSEVRKSLTNHFEKFISAMLENQKKVNRMQKIAILSNWEEFSRIEINC